jgi:hypothetical protein
MQRFSITAQLDNDGNGSYAELDVCEDEDGDWVKASDALSAIVELERALAAKHKELVAKKHPAKMKKLGGE